MLNQKLMGVTSSDKLYVDDVFSTYLYTGNGGTQTITNGIDLAGKGGLVWIKNRTNGANNALWDTIRGAGTSSSSPSNKSLSSNSTAAEGLGSSTEYLSAFGSTGFTVQQVGTTLSNRVANDGSSNYASWTFRKAAKFFDVQTITHTTGTASTINLSTLGTVGTVIAKITTNSGDWTVWHRSLTAGNNMQLNTNTAQSTSNAWLSVSGTTATLSGSAPTGTYVVYGFAHDTATDGLIRCGNFTTDASGNATVAGLGWEPQWVLMKEAQGLSDWRIFDVGRGWNDSPGSQMLWSNLSTAETSSALGMPTATGFTRVGSASATYIYIAIRRPNKPPTTGTQVFTPVAYTGTGANNTVTSGFATDMVIQGNRTVSTSSVKFGVWDRLRGVNSLLTTTTTNESAASMAVIQANPWDSMTGLKVGTTSSLTNASGNTFAYWMFKRAPGVFDTVCYTGTGVAGTFDHNLGAVPELMILKARNQARFWPVYHAAVGATKNLELNTTTEGVAGSLLWNNTPPTSTGFTVGAGAAVNGASNTYVAYLFATLPGISKVGSYAGNGTSQTIDCGFSAGARFVMVKRTDLTGDWYVWDTARGIVAGTDPRLSLNSTNAESVDDSVDAATAGFVVNQVAATNINVTGGTYIFLAIA